MSNASNFDQRNKENLESTMAVIEKQFESTTICSAKWLQSTVNLYNGTTHSCHHCPRHSASVEAIRANPAALHNTEQKRREREKMLSNERPPECNYCWQAEDNNTISDRTLKTVNTEWSVQHLDRLEDDNPNPSYLEVAFDTTCNLSCLYCGPGVSSKWFEEIMRNGPFGTSCESHGLGLIYRDKELAIPNNQYNPFKEAFWEWWPELNKSLKVFRITGGEPLLSKSAWQAMNLIKEDPNPEMVLVINSNMSVEDVFIDRIIKYANDVEGKLKDFQLCASCEAFGEQANYIRHGMDYDKFIQNCTKFLEQTKTSRITMTLTINALSVFSMREFLEEMYRLRERFGRRLIMSFAFLRYPGFMDIRVLNKDKLYSVLTEVKELVIEKGTTVEVEQMERLIRYAMSIPKDLEVRRRDLKIFLNEWDTRKGLDHSKVFPLLNDFLM